MNKAALLGALLAFVVPIGVMVAVNFESFGSNSGNSKPTGKLMYFYSPS